MYLLVLVPPNFNVNPPCCLEKRKLFHPKYLRWNVNCDHMYVAQMDLAITPTFSHFFNIFAGCSFFSLTFWQNIAQKIYII
jgi:hypothetical protein